MGYIQNSAISFLMRKNVGGEKWSPTKSKERNILISDPRPFPFALLKTVKQLFHYFSVKNYLSLLAHLALITRRTHDVPTISA